MSNTQKDVAVFIDFENIYVSVREKFDATPNFESLMERCEDYGRVVVARAYADWYRYPRITSALFANNIEPMYVPTYYYDKDEGRTGRPIKNSVDMHMCIDAMRTLYTRTNISTYVFITGDRDFIALVNCVRQEGKDVVIVGIGGAASSHLAQSADEFLFYEQIVDIRPMGHGNFRRSRSTERSQERGSDRSSDRPDRNGGLTSSAPSSDRRRDRSPERPQERERMPELPATPPPAAVTPPPAAVTPAAATPPPAAATPPPAIQPIVASPHVTQPTPSGADESIYDRLVEALDLARKRGYVSSFGSLKVLMKELMPNFKESRYRDSQGRPFTKFTDFVREAERLGKIQIFTSGTVNEVFLPHEDPYKLSQFAEDLPSVEAERELEEELALEAQKDRSERSERSGRRRRRRGSPRSESSTVEDIMPEEDSSSDEVYTFGDQEWDLFYRVMQAYKEPVPFADIFNDLRELRNAEELELTNNALKELIKQAINEQRLQRSNRGAKAHYRLLDTPPSGATTTAPDMEDLSDDEDPHIDASPLPDLDDEDPHIDASPLPDLDDEDPHIDASPLPDLDDEDESAVITQQIQEAMQPQAVDQEQEPEAAEPVAEQVEAVDHTSAEASDAEIHAEQASATVSEFPSAEDMPEDMPTEAPELETVTTAETQATEAQAPAKEDEKPKPKRRRRKKVEDTAETKAAPPTEEDEKPKSRRRKKVEDTAETKAAPPTKEEEKPKSRRRKKVEDTAETKAAPPTKEEEKPKPKRRRRKKAEEPAESAEDAG